jgi:hypothetical protein
LLGEVAEQPISTDGQLLSSKLDNQSPATLDATQGCPSVVAVSSVNLAWGVCGATKHRNGQLLSYNLGVHSVSLSGSAAERPITIDEFYLFQALPSISRRRTQVQCSRLLYQRRLLRSIRGREALKGPVLSDPAWILSQARPLYLTVQRNERSINRRPRTGGILRAEPTVGDRVCCTRGACSAASVGERP